MALTVEAIADMIKSTRKDEGRLKWTNLSNSLQEYIAMSQIMKKERVQFESGNSIQWNIQTGTNGAAHPTGINQTDTYTQSDVLNVASVPWRHCTTNWSIDRRLLAMNRDPAKIVDLIKLGRCDALSSQARMMEDHFWGKPADSNDTLLPFGIDYWIVSNATEGFNGGNASGFTSGPGGLDSSVYTAWKNYTAQYTDVSKIDLIRKWRRASTMTRFKPPVENPNYSAGSRYGYYMNYDTYSALEEALEAQNDNLGNDVASKDGKVMFKGVACTYVPKLDALSTDPVYGIDWGVFRVAVLKGEYMVESEPRLSSNSHYITVTDVDTSYNYMCYDRRSLFILAKS